jgi:hypothetical protein
VTALEVEMLRILEDESARSPMPAESLGRVLHCLGFSPEPSVAELVAVLDGLVTGGWCERVHSARLGARYRIMRNQPGVDMSAPGAA